MYLFENDFEAAKALKDGNMQALEYFYNSYQRTVQLFLKSYCADEAELDEITQETFIRLWENRQKIRAELNVKNLLFTIAKNKAIDQVRHTRSHAKVIKLQQQERPENYNTLDHIILADYNRVLAVAMMQLPPRNREVFALSRNTHLSNAEISEKLNISVKAVEKHITKTLHFLRAFLTEQQIMPLFIPVIFYFFSK